MKKTVSQIFKTGSFVVIALVIGSVSLHAADKLKVAVVNIGKVFDEYEKTKRFDQDLQKDGRTKQEERDGIVKDIRKLRDEQALLNEEAKGSKQDAIEKKMKELDAFDEETKKVLAEKRNDAVKDVFQDIEVVMKQYGERKGYDLVLNDRAVLYSPTSYDVTAEVLSELNQKYQKDKK